LKDLYGLLIKATVVNPGPDNIYHFVVFLSGSIYCRHEFDNGGQEDGEQDAAEQHAGVHDPRLADATRRSGAVINGVMMRHGTEQ
jgi:hypothetical protein